MSKVAVGERLKNGRSVAGPTAFGRPGDRVAHDEDVVAVDEFGRDVVRRSAVRGRVRHRGDGADRRVLHVEVVLTHEDHGELPHGGEVERLVEGTDVRGTVAEERDGDLAGATEHRRPGRADGHGQVGAHDGVRAEHEAVGLGEVHRAALGLAQPGGLAHQFGEAGLGGGAAGDGVVVSPVGGEHVVVGTQGGAGPDGNGLVSGGEVGGALDQSGEEQVVGGLLGATDHGHLLVQGE